MRVPWRLPSVVASVAVASLVVAGSGAGRSSGEDLAGPAPCGARDDPLDAVRGAPRGPLPMLAGRRTRDLDDEGASEESTTEGDGAAEDAPATTAEPGTATEAEAGAEEPAEPPPRTVRLRGRVVDGAGRPLDGIVVVADGGTLADPWTTTDAAGRFEGLASEVGDGGATRVRLEALGQHHAATLRVPDGEDEEEVALVWEIDEDDVRTVEGRVETDDGAPAAGALVVYREREPAPARRASGFHGGVARCDAQGRYALRAPAYFVGCTSARGIGVVVATLRGHGAVAAAVPRTNGTATVDLRLARGVVLDGVVVDEEGSALADAVVAVRARSSVGVPVAGARRGPDREQPAPDGHLLVETRTDADGRFTLEGVPAGVEAVLVARSPRSWGGWGWCRRASRPVTHALAWTPVPEGGGCAWLRLPESVGARDPGDPLPPPPR